MTKVVYCDNFHPFRTNNLYTAMIIDIIYINSLHQPRHMIPFSLPWTNCVFNGAFPVPNINFYLFSVRLFIFSTSVNLVSSLTISFHGEKFPRNGQWRNDLPSRPCTAGGCRSRGAPKFHLS